MLGIFQYPICGRSLREITSLLSHPDPPSAGTTHPLAFAPAGAAQKPVAIDRRPRKLPEPHYARVPVPAPLQGFSLPWHPTRADRCRTIFFAATTRVWA